MLTGSAPQWLSKRHVEHSGAHCVSEEEIASINLSDIATNAGTYRTARPDLTELQLLLRGFLLLGGSHLCDQTLERLERLLGEISVEFGNLF